MRYWTRAYLLPQVRPSAPSDWSVSVQSRGFEPLPVNSSVAASYAEIAAATHRVKKKSSARSHDLMIAATAHAHGARLVNANMKDVKHLDHILEIVDVR